MLIIVGGVETIHRKWIAGEVRKAMNTFIVDDYSVKFVSNTYKVTSLISTSTPATIVNIDGDNVETQIGMLSVEEGEVVFDGTAGINKLLSFNSGGATLNKIEELATEVFLDGTRDTHYANVFVDNLYDLGITTTHEFQVDNYLHPTGYDDVVAAYNNRKFENFTISGCFSKYFIDLIRQDLGAENVKVLNITRNPSAAVIIHPKPPAYYIKNTTYTEDFDRVKLPLSLVCATNLTRFSDIETIKFEDICKAGKFTINGVDIPMPDPHTMANEWLTQYERDEIVAELDPADVTTRLNNANMIFSALGTIQQVPGIPDNLFEIMGYPTLDYTTLIS